MPEYFQLQYLYAAMKQANYQNQFMRICNNSILPLKSFKRKRALQTMKATYTSVTNNHE